MRQTASIRVVPVDSYAPLIPLGAIRLFASQNPNEEWLSVPAGAIVHDRGKSEVLGKSHGHEGDAFWRRDVSAIGSSHYHNSEELRQSLRKQVQIVNSTIVDGFVSVQCEREILFETAPFAPAASWLGWSKTPAIRESWRTT